MFDNFVGLALKGLIVSSTVQQSLHNTGAKGNNGEQWQKVGKTPMQTISKYLHPEWKSRCFLPNVSV